LSISLLALVAIGCGTNEEAGPVESVPSRIVKIMPIGDSITAGPYYRLPLVRAMVEAGCPVDFVGTFNGVGDVLPDDAAQLDLDHQAVGGATSADIRSQFAGWIEDQQPDIALVYLGINDLYHDLTRDQTLENLEAIIGDLRERNNSVTVLVAQIMPGVAVGAAVADLNAQIQLLADRLDTAASPVVAVDMAEGVDVETDLVDGVHPNEARDAEMAARWIDALRGELSTACTL
jgi:lysophospholipase L1-like esterase